MKRKIKFRRVHFFDEKKTRFSHFSYWGINLGQTTFTSPSSNNYALYFTDDQFTGLKDKNGVDVYDGDYINIFDDSCRNYGKGSITFIKGGFQCCDMHLQDIYYENCTTEVIGNIHQNPELLNG